MEAVPVYKLSDLDESSNFKEVEHFFETNFKQSPDFYVRCPGRVNLIGEHIDYSGFSVLPIAIEKDVILAVGKNNEEKFNIFNLDDEKYLPFSKACKITDFNIKNHPQWYDYILSGCKGICEKFEVKYHYLNIAVKGVIPPGAGLSSSSALVCAGALAISYINRIHLSKVEMADLCASSERYVGTQGGGMDQAIIFLGEKGFAKKIEFNPLRTANVLLPKEIDFFVVHSGVTMNKAATPYFNKRVAECRLAAKILAKKLDLNWAEVERLGELPVLLNKTLDEMVCLVNKLLSKNSYCKDEICSALEIKIPQLQEFLEKFNLSDSASSEKFDLYHRAIHVFTEAKRVDDFIYSCAQKDFEMMGDSFSSSHYSLRDYYDCSHSKLDALVEAAKQAGAIGARLTGAGWGGCVIAAVESTHKEKFLEKFKDCTANYDLDWDLLFLTQPSCGAAIYSDLK